MRTRKKEGRGRERGRRESGRLSRGGEIVLFKDGQAEMRRVGVLMASGVRRAKLYYLHAAHVALLSKANVAGVSFLNNELLELSL